MSITDTTYIVTTDDGSYSVTKWYNELGWIQTDVRTAWKPSFIIFPKKSRFSYKRIWGNVHIREVKFMCDAAGHDPAVRDIEYATTKEVFEDRLKGAA